MTNPLALGLTARQQPDGGGEPPASAALHLLIEGRVQGVGFRWAMVQEAKRLGLQGWVRNRHEGSVEAVAAGTPSALAEWCRWARRGPPDARVDRVTERLASEHELRLGAPGDYSSLPSG